jgi:hypothetical protein
LGASCEEKSPASVDGKCMSSKAPKLRVVHAATMLRRLHESLSAPPPRCKLASLSRLCPACSIDNRTLCHRPSRHKRRRSRKLPQQRRSHRAS